MMVILSIMLWVWFSSGWFLSLPPLELVPWVNGNGLLQVYHQDGLNVTC